MFIGVLSLDWQLPYGKIGLLVAAGCATFARQEPLQQINYQSTYPIFIKRS
jgi:hypothetical protein